jgi:DNA-binding LytR/AlgR family response regulator
MLRVLAVDDEAPALCELAYLLREDKRVEHVATAPDGMAALKDMVRMIGTGERLDGVFLDIRMPGLDGLALAGLVEGFPAPPRLVFVTAHEECAVQAFDLAAVDYLLKPVRPERLALAIGRLSAAVAAPADMGPGDVIPVELGGHTRFVPQESILYVEAQGDYVRLHTAEGNYLVRMSLAELERRWADSGFLRVHRSTLVAIRHVTELRYEAGRILLQIGDQSLPVSRRHARQVRERLIRPREARQRERRLREARLWDGTL